jgi:hypothetical protein
MFPTCFPWIVWPMGFVVAKLVDERQYYKTKVLCLRDVGWSF